MKKKSNQVELKESLLDLTKEVVDLRGGALTSEKLQDRGKSLGI